MERQRKLGLAVITAVLAVLLAGSVSADVSIQKTYSSAQQTTTEYAPVQDWQSVNTEGYTLLTQHTSYDAYLKPQSNFGDGFRYCDTISGVEHCITYQPQDVSYRDANGAQDYLSALQSSSASQAGASVTYSSAFPNTDLRYTADQTSIKEEFIINNAYRAPNTGGLQGGNITLDFGGYVKFPTASPYVDGVEQTTDFVTSEAIEFRTDSGDLLWTLPQPYAVDADGNRTTLQYEVDFRQNQIWFYTRTPYSWLANATYPVTVDPTVQDPYNPEQNMSVVTYQDHGNTITSYLYRAESDGSYTPINNTWYNNTQSKFGATDAQNNGSANYTYLFRSEFPNKLYQDGSGDWWFGRYKVNVQDICAQGQTPAPNCSFTNTTIRSNNTLTYELAVDFTSDGDIDPTFDELADGSTVVTYTTDGTFNLSSETTVEYLVVAGGGDGGYESSTGSNGGNSVFHNITATGGGAGGASSFGGTQNGASGGSGGGAGDGDSVNAANSGGSGIAGQGNNGGGSPDSSRAGGGGGGAGGGGGSGSTSDNGGNGGVGLQSNITGTLTYYAGGGGGGAGTGNDRGCGGLGGGGDGGDNTGNQCANPGPAVDGTGGGGGGRFDGNDGAGGGGAGGMLTGNITLGAGSYTVNVGAGAGNGANGIVILRYTQVDCSVPQGRAWVFDISSGCPLNETRDLGADELIIRGASGTFAPTQPIYARSVRIEPDDFDGDFVVDMTNIITRPAPSIFSSTSAALSVRLDEVNTTDQLSAFRSYRADTLTSIEVLEDGSSVGTCTTSPCSLSGDFANVNVSWNSENFTDFTVQAAPLSSGETSTSAGAHTIDVVVTDDFGQYTHTTNVDVTQLNSWTSTSLIQLQAEQGSLAATSFGNADVTTGDISTVDRVEIILDNGQSLYIDSSEGVTNQEITLGPSNDIFLEIIDDRSVTGNIEVVLDASITADTVFEPGDIFVDNNDARQFETEVFASGGSGTK